MATRHHRDEIESYLNTLLEVDRFKDYGPNGLQVEGRAEVRRVVSGVTASLALIDAANEAGGKDNIAVLLARVQGSKAAPRSWWPFRR